MIDSSETENEIETPESGASKRGMRVQIELEPPMDNKILQSVRRYRASLRQMFAVATLVHAAGGDIVVKKRKAGKVEEDSVNLIPKNVRAEAILAAAIHQPHKGKPAVESQPGPRGEGVKLIIQAGKLPFYSMRDWFLTHLYPEAEPVTWDAARRMLGTLWKAKDPEFNKAQRGYLTLQGSRHLAQLHGIGITIPSVRITTEGYKLSFAWDKSIGPVTFDLPEKLDPYRRDIWQKIVDGAPGWKLGSVAINSRYHRKERRNVYLLQISYSRPQEFGGLDPNKTLIVELTDEAQEWMIIRGPHRLQEEKISAESVLSFLQTHKVRSARLKRQLGANGQPRRPWGHRNGHRDCAQRLARLTENRDRIEKDYNHAWTRRIACAAVKFKCGMVTFTAPPPDENGYGQLFGYPWSWTQFEANLKYKVEHRGGQLVDPSAGETVVDA